MKKRKGKKGNKGLEKLNALIINIKIKNLLFFGYL